MAWRCTDCGSSFADDFRLYQQKLSKKHSCQHCGRSTEDKYALMEHMRTHMLYHCDICSKTFFLARSLEQHMEMSTHSKKSRTKIRKRARRGCREGQGKNKLTSSSSTNGESLSTSLHQLSISPASLKPKFIAELEQFESVDAFLKKKVMPDRETLEQCNHIVERLMNFLQHNTKYSVANVFKGGSLAKGTSIRKKNDIDIAVFLNDFNGIRAMSRGMKEVLEYLRDHLDGATFADDIEFKWSKSDFTKHSIQFKLKCSPDDEHHDVDLLPAVDMLKKGSEESVYRQMLARTKKRAYYSVCFAPLQVEFVKKSPARVKDLIRLVKHWKRIENVDQLISYTIELIVIEQWEKWGKPEAFDLKDKLRDVLGVISDLRSLNIEWPECYALSQYGGLPDARIVVMDPANPFMNTADKIRTKDIPKIEATARRSLALL